MPLVATRGAASAQGFGEFAQSAVPVYIEQIFSTWLYTGNGSTQTITNGIDLSTYGGLVWTKSRNAAFRHYLFDTARGMDKDLSTNNTDAQGSGGLASATSTGFSFGGNTNGNQSGTTFGSWTFRKQPKFFDVVTYTGNGGTLSVSHSLASKPGCIIIKRTDSTGDWLVCTRKSDGNIYAMYLNTTAGQFYDGTEGSLWTSTAVSINWINSNVAAGFNTNGATYVMYLFAHDAGGFGLTGTDNVISCGSFTTDGSGVADVTLGYEPQFCIIKSSSNAEDWYVLDTMRGWNLSNADAVLYPNLSNAEVSSNYGNPTATGFRAAGLFASRTYIYIAIRRGPMKTPTSGTSVFSPNVATSGTVTTNFPIDMQILSDKGNNNSTLNQQFVDRLRGVSSTTTQQGVYLLSSSTAAESSAFPYSSKQWSNTGFGVPQNYEGASSLYLSFRRAPGFFDEVCYTGTGSATTFNHNLGVVPELMIVKSRNTATTDWDVLSNFTVSSFKDTLLNLSNSATNQSYGPGGSPNFEMMTAQPSSTAFYLSSSAQLNFSGRTFVAYLFATVPGVSKVGTFTGNGTSQTINCGFTTGARFVLVKATSTTGDWLVVDTARGLVAAGDPTLYLNSTAAEVTGADWIDPDASGFIVNQEATMNANASGISYLFLAIS